jgi:uncharacterized CHY-type Zn-finger protein
MAVFDFTEFMARGISAARAHQTTEAIKYLELAAEMQPKNVRVWLWLAAVVQTGTLKRRCLQKALQIDPHSVMAKVLLERLERHSVRSPSNMAEHVSFTCGACGGKQRFDPELNGLVCDYCKRVEVLAVDELPAHRQENAAEQTMGNWAAGINQLICQACGAKLTVLPHMLTSTCPFCTSENILSKSLAQALFKPDEILPFQCFENEVRGLVADYKEPKKFWQFFGEEKPLEIVSLNALYLPFWRFSGRVQIYCALNRRIPLIIYTEDEKVFLKGDWPCQKTWYEVGLKDVFIYAAKSANPQAVLAVFPYELSSVTTYREAILSGWQAEFYQVARQDALLLAEQKMRDQALERAAQRMLFINPGDLLQGDILVEQDESRLCLLPVWLCQVQRGEERQTLIINGQTGKVAR